MTDLTAPENPRLPITTAPYPEPCKKVLHDLMDLMEEMGWSQTEAARKIKHGPRKNKLSTAALSQLLGGQYKADPTALCKAIERMINLERGRALFVDGGFVTTRLYKVLHDLADVAVITQRIGCLHGGLYAGKTTNGRALAGQYGNASTVFTTMPYADTYGGFIRRLANQRGLSLRGSLSDIRERILASLDSSHLLIIDEFHQALINYPHSQSVRVFEFIREINDLSRCAILLLGASTGYGILSTHPDYSRFAAAITAVDITNPKRDLRPGADSRGGDDDLAAICKSFGLEANPHGLSLCQTLVRDHSVARLFDAFRLANGRAENRNQPLSWEHVFDVQATTLELAA